MNPTYADLYGECLVEENLGTYALRNAAIDEILNKATLVEMLETVRVFYGRPPANPEFVGKFNSVFSSKDAGFKTVNNDLERKILAGITILRYVTERTGRESNVVALAALCADLNGKNRSVSNSQMIPELERRIDDATRQRWAARVGVPILEIKNSGDQIRKKLKDLVEPVDMPKYRDVFEMLIKHVYSYSERFAAKSDLLAEEVNMLWWVVNCQTPAITKEKSGGGEAAPILYGKELAALAVVEIGPANGLVFLKKALENQEPSSEVTILGSVNSLDTKSKADLTMLSKPHDPLFFPILTAIAKAFEADGGEWSKQFKKVTSIDTGVPLKKVDLAFQTYREILLARLLDNQEK